MTPFVKAMIYTAAPIVVVSAISAVGVAANQPSGVSWAFLWFIPVFMAIAALIASIIYFFKGKKQIAAGMLVGFGIGVLALGGSCFAISSGL